MDIFSKLASRSFVALLAAQARFNQAKDALEEAMGMETPDAAEEYHLAEMEYKQAKVTDAAIHKAWRKSIGA
jgi:hypothetical protein